MRSAKTERTVRASRSGFRRQTSRPPAKTTSATQTYCMPCRWTPRFHASAEATAARTSRAIRPRIRSISTTVVASVFEPAKGAVSATRTTSPPILLGRKLLKKVATRKDLVSVLRPTSICLEPEQQAPAPGADREHETVDAEGRDGPRGVHLPEARRHGRHICPAEQDDEQDSAHRQLEDDQHVLQFGSGH